jgi:hypothetical protein
MDRKSLVLVIFVIFLFAAGNLFASPAQETPPEPLITSQNIQALQNAEEAVRRAQAESSAKQQAADAASRASAEAARQAGQQPTAPAARPSAPAPQQPLVVSYGAAPAIPRLQSVRLADASDWVVRIGYDLPIDLNTFDINAISALLANGPISQYDLMNGALPFENSFIVGGITGADLYLLGNYIASTPQAYNVGQVFPGIDFSVNSFGYVDSVSYAGQQVGLSEFFIYITNDYLFESEGAFSLIVKVDSRIDSKDLLGWTYTQLVNYLEYIVSPYVVAPPVYVTR